MQVKLAIYTKSECRTIQLVYSTDQSMPRVRVLARGGAGNSCCFLRKVSVLQDEQLLEMIAQQ